MQPETSERDSRSQKERMLAGDEYLADDPVLNAERARAAILIAELNATVGDETARREMLLRTLLGRMGHGCEIRSPFFCDYGYQISLGDRVFANFGLVALDVGKITIGDDAKLGPNVQLLAATHPTDPAIRLTKWEGSRPITIGRNAWLGGGVIVCPGVTIGDNTVVGAGSVVVRNLPSNVVAVGNPARIVREL